MTSGDASISIIYIALSRPYNTYTRISTSPRVAIIGKTRILHIMLVY